MQGDSAIDHAVDAVMMECAFTGKRGTRRHIADAMRLVIAKRGTTPEKVRAGMVAAWLEYLAEIPMLAYVWSPRTFFRDGHWLNPESWPYDRSLLRELRNRPSTF